MPAQSNYTVPTTSTVAVSALANGTGAAFSAIYNPKVWAAKGIIAREPVKVLAKMAVSYSDDVKGFGDTINIQTIENLVANTKVDQTTVTLQQPNGFNRQITINQSWESSFLVEDVLAEQAKLRLQEEWTPKAVEIIERTKDKLLAQLVLNSSSFVGALGTAISDANVIAAIVALDNAFVPTDGRRFVVTPSARGDIMKIDKYVGIVIGASVANGTSSANSSVYSMNTVKTGDIGTVYGIPVNMTQNLLVDATGKHNILMHESALALAEQIDTEILQNYVPQFLGHLTTGRGLWGQQSLRVDHMVDFRS